MFYFDDYHYLQSRILVFYVICHDEPTALIFNNVDQHDHRWRNQCLYCHTKCQRIEFCVLSFVMSCQCCSWDTRCYKLPPNPVFELRKNVLTRMRLGFLYPLWLLYILHADFALCLPQDTCHPLLWTWGKHMWFVTFCLTNIASFLFFFLLLLFSVLYVSACWCVWAAQNHGGALINYTASLVILLIICLIGDGNGPYYPRTQYLGTSSSACWFMVSFLFYNCWTYNDTCDQVLYIVCYSSNSILWCFSSSW